MTQIEARGELSRSRRKPAITIACWFAAVLMSACKSTSDDSMLGVYLINASQTDVYKYGPAQSFGADFALKEGTKVVVVEYDKSYSRIMTEDGLTGYVATEDLKRAPQPPKHQPVAMSQSGGRGRIRGGPQSSANRAIMESGPLFESGELPPLPDQTVEPPSFRHTVPTKE